MKSLYIIFKNLQNLNNKVYDIKPNFDQIKETHRHWSVLHFFKSKD